MAPASPFLDSGTHASATQLAIVQLRRDQLIPVVLQPDGASDYAEGRVENTRFGSFPHSTLVGQPWGTQVLASVVDTGSRGKSRKRKRDAQGGEDEDGDGAGGAAGKRELAQAPAASSGFAHIIPPTPEMWTLSLPHRTQVVYTPDYSYVLQRLRVRPGDCIIEAGAGSGSFTHAAARAVYNGFPGLEKTSNGATNGIDEENAVGMSTKRRRKKPNHFGSVYSFEYHEPRAQQLRAEIHDHGLDGIVTITHRDVYADGFTLPSRPFTEHAITSPPAVSSTPNANAIFLDLPAPWLALQHLSRTTPSPLNPHTPIHICTFSPCIEQVSRTVSTLRSLGWVEIDMVELQSRRLDVRRERVGLDEEGVRGGNASARCVGEAVQRLRDVEGRAKVFHGLQKEKQGRVMRRAEAQKRGEKRDVDCMGDGEAGDDKQGIAGEGPASLPPSKLDRLERVRREAENRPLYKQGRLVHRTEPEIKTHTSYLVFAVLPREWSAEDEKRARKKWAKK